jgi:DNA-binding transcriptional MerR regulator
MALTIGRLAQATGVSAKTIRYYEQVGVLPNPGRSRAGYRQYTRQTIDRLLFIHRARGLGLPLRQVRALSAALDGPPGSMRPRLLGLVAAHLTAIEARIADLQRLRGQLEGVMQRLDTPVPRDGRPCRCLDHQPS